MLILKTIIFILCCIFILCDGQYNSSNEPNTDNYQLYIKRQNSKEQFEIVDDIANSISIDYKLKTKVLFPSTDENCHGKFANNVTKTFFLFGNDFNIICINYKNSLTCESINALATFVRKNVINLSLPNTHFIGYNRGNSILYECVKLLLADGLKLFQITLLDPVKVPNCPKILNFNGTMASYIESLHTSAFFNDEDLNYPNFDIMDFYPNGGTLQPYCSRDILKCSREKSILYYIMSIPLPNMYHAFKCNNLADAINKNCNISTTVFFGNIESYGNETGLYYFKTMSGSFAEKSAAKKNYEFLLFNPIILLINHLAVSFLLL